MGFKGVDKKNALIITLIFIGLAAILNFTISFKVCLIFISLGLVASGAIGLKIKSYAFISRDALNGQNNNKFESFVLFMNFFLLFFGLYTIAQQII